MGKITWNTDVNAPCCPGEIIGPALEQERDARGRFLPVERQTLLIQTDWDYPGVASAFGWSTRSVQRCPGCGRIVSYEWQRGPVNIATCDECESIFPACEHSATDGTVNCPCGVQAGAFIAAADEWLRDNDGATADDPGYFD